MKKQNAVKKQGFTLIELLVVVLIIGILAAIALPQYKKAVIKSRAAAIMPILDMLAKGEEIYYTAHGQGTLDARELDIQLPGTCVPTTDDNDKGKTWSCDKDFRVGLDSKGSAIWAVYCPNHNTSKVDCDPNKYFQLGWATSFFEAANDSNRYAPNSRRCWVPKNANPMGEEICKLLGKQMMCREITCYEIQ